MATEQEVQAEDAANKQRGELTITLGPKKFVLEPKFENIQAIESLLGRSFLKISSEFSAKSPVFTMSEIANIIYVAQVEPKVSFKKIGDLLAKYGILGVLVPLANFTNCAVNGSDLKNEETEDKAQEKK